MASHLTDAQLRKKLIELGEDVGPVDASTRYLWERKLIRLLASQKAKKVPSHSPLLTSQSQVVPSSSTRSILSESINLSNISSISGIEKSHSYVEEDITDDFNNQEMEIEEKTFLEEEQMDLSSFEEEQMDLSSFEDEQANLTSFEERRNLASIEEENIDFLEEETATPESTQFHPEATIPGIKDDKSRAIYSFNRQLERQYSQEYRDSVSNLEEYQESASILEETHLPKKSFPSFQVSKLLPLLVIIVGVFSGILLFCGTFTYVNYEQALLDLSALNVPLCQKSDFQLFPSTPYLPGNYCIEPDLINETLELAKELFSVLSLEAGKHQCGYRSEPEILETELRKELEDRFKHLTSIHFFRNYMKTLLLLQDNNHLPIKFHYSKDANGQLYDFEKLEALTRTQPFWCQFMSNIKAWVNGIVCVFLVVIPSSYYLISYYIKKQEKDRKIIYSFVDKIIQHLKNNYDYSFVDPTTPSFLAVAHIRDTLIPMAQRKALRTHWEKAVEIIEKSEARVRVDHRMISGEKFRVWSWIQF